MGTIGIVLLVFFIIVCALLVLLVAIQDDGENGMGGLLGGRGTQAFGSHSASVLTKATGVLVGLFFVKECSDDKSVQDFENAISAFENENKYYYDKINEIYYTCDTIFP